MFPALAPRGHFLSNTLPAKTSHSSVNLQTNSSAIEAQNTKENNQTKNQKKTKMVMICWRSRQLLLPLLALFATALLCLMSGPASANPLLAHQQSADASQPKTKKFWSQPEVSAGGNFRGFFPVQGGGPPVLMPYADGSGFVSSFPAGLPDRWSGFVADEQFAGGASKRTVDGHFMEPSGWLGLGEPGRLEWNFNRLR